MTVKRYGTSCTEHPEGIYVLHKDYLALIERCASIAECYDLGTPEGHEIAAAIRKLLEQS